jgi:hypothetical protein
MSDNPIGRLSTETLYNPMEKCLGSQPARDRETNARMRTRPEFRIEVGIGNP